MASTRAALSSAASRASVCASNAAKAFAQPMAPINATHSNPDFKRMSPLRPRKKACGWCATRRRALNIATSSRRPRAGTTVTCGLKDSGKSEILLAFVTRDERAPGLRANRTLGLPHHVELAVGLDFA